MDGAFCIQILICNVFMMGPELRIQMTWLFKMGGRYPSLIRDVIVRLALVYFTIVFKFIFCSAQVFILSRV